MRHKVYGSKLGRNKNERAALFKSLVQAILIHGTIETSESKVKAIKGLIDKVINLAKNKNTHHLLSSFLTQKNLEKRLISEIVPKLSDRTSGYTSTVRLNSRHGDNTGMMRMSIVGSEKLDPIKKVIKEKKQKIDKEPVKKVVKKVTKKE